MLFVDLTKTFGEGNEPTKEEMDVFMDEYFEDGWFNGGASLGGYLKFIQDEFEELKEEVSQQTDMVIPVLDVDPENPKVGQMWIVRWGNSLLREDFTGADGSPLNTATWEVVKSGSTHAPGNGATIQSDQAEFSVASSDGGEVGLFARMKKFKIDWSNEKRVVSWMQQPHQWYGVWGMGLSNKVQVDGGGNFADYAIRVVHSSANTSMQMKNVTQTQVVYNQKFPHGASENDWKSFRLEVSTDKVELYMNDLLYLTAENPDIGVTDSWLYFYAETSNASAIVNRIDSVVVV